MKTIRFVMLLGGALLFGAQPLSAALITFDFGTGGTNNNSQTPGSGTQAPDSFGAVEEGNFNEVAEFDALSTESTTLNGLEMTITGIAVDGNNNAADDLWGANTQGLGIHTDGGTNGASRRIDGSIGEAITFSFDQDVFLSSLTLGSFAAAGGVNEEVTVAVAGGSTITIVGTVNNAQELRPLGGVAVSAGTLVTLTTSVPQGGGVLFNQITVETIPEPSSIALVGMALVGLGFVRRRR